MTKFTSRITSGGMVNIPENVRDMNDFERGDLLEVKVVKHKQDGQMRILDPEEDHEVENTNE